MNRRPFYANRVSIVFQKKTLYKKEFMKFKNFVTFIIRRRRPVQRGGPSAPFQPSCPGYLDVSHLNITIPAMATSIPAAFLSEKGCFSIPQIPISSMM